MKLDVNTLKEKKYKCHKCKKIVNEECTVWLANDPYHVKCAPQENRWGQPAHGRMIEWFEQKQGKLFK
jgi:hypothetical protein